MQISRSAAEPAGFPEAAFDWQPDAERLERETRLAELRRQCDDLTLAEIECSLDLIDAEIASMRRRPAWNAEPDPKLRELSTVRGKLASLMARLQRLPHCSRLAGLAGQPNFRASSPGRSG